MPIRPTLWGQPVDLLMTGSDSVGRSGDPVTRRLVAEAIDRLMDEGPSLGRPLADRIAGSRLHNLKELRPGSSGASEVRILFIFDPVRNAVLLVAGDKSGRWEDPGAGRNGTAASSRSSPISATPGSASPDRRGTPARRARRSATFRLFLGSDFSPLGSSCRPALSSACCLAPRATTVTTRPAGMRPHQSTAMPVRPVGHTSAAMMCNDVIKSDFAGR